MSRTWMVDPNRIVCPWRGHSYQLYDPVPEQGIIIQCATCGGKFQLDESRVKK